MVICTVTDSTPFVLYQVRSFRLFYSFKAIHKSHHKLMTKNYSQIARHYSSLPSSLSSSPLFPLLLFISSSSHFSSSPLLISLSNFCALLLAVYFTFQRGHATSRQSMCAIRYDTADMMMMCEREDTGALCRAMPAGLGHPHLKLKLHRPQSSSPSPSPPSTLFSIRIF